MQAEDTRGRVPPPPPRGADSANGGNVDSAAGGRHVTGAGWARPTDVTGKGSGQLGPTVQAMARRRRQLSMGGLRQLPRVYPADEILNRAINAALRLKEDTSIKNSRQRARKWGAARIQLLSSGPPMPLPCGVRPAPCVLPSGRWGADRRRVWGAGGAERERGGGLLAACCADMHVRARTMTIRHAQK